MLGPIPAPTDLGYTKPWTEYQGDNGRRRSPLRVTFRWGQDSRTQNFLKGRRR